MTYVKDVYMYIFIIFRLMTLKQAENSSRDSEIRLCFSRLHVLLYNLWQQFFNIRVLLTNVTWRAKTL